MGALAGTGTLASLGWAGKRAYDARKESCASQPFRAPGVGQPSHALPATSSTPSGGAATQVTLPDVDVDEARTQAYGFVQSDRNVEGLRALLKKHPNIVNLPYQGDVTLLGQACDYGIEDIIAVLLDNDADVAQRSGTGGIPLQRYMNKARGLDLALVCRLSQGLPDNVLAEQLSIGAYNYKEIGFIEYCLRERPDAITAPVLTSLFGFTFEAENDAGLFLLFKDFILQRIHLVEEMEKHHAGHHALRNLFTKAAYKAELWQKFSQKSRLAIAKKVLGTKLRSSENDDVLVGRFEQECVNESIHSDDE